MTELIAAVCSWTSNDLIAAIRAECPYLSDEWELAARLGLESHPKKQRNELERILVNALAPKDTSCDP